MANKDFLSEWKLDAPDIVKVGEYVWRRYRHPAYHTDGPKELGMVVDLTYRLDFGGDRVLEVRYRPKGSYQSGRPAKTTFVEISLLRRVKNKEGDVVDEKALELVEIVNRDADKDDSGKVRSMEVASRDGFRPADRCPFIFSSLVLTQYLPSYITKELADLVELKRGKLWQENLPEEIVQRLRAARQLVERRQQQRRPRTRELITGD